MRNSKPRGLLIHEARSPISGLDTPSPALHGTCARGKCAPGASIATDPQGYSTTTYELQITDLRSLFPRTQILQLGLGEHVDLDAYSFELEAGTSHRREKRAGLLLREAINPELLPIY